jgi:hypothetical protein
MPRGFGPTDDWRGYGINAPVPGLLEDGPDYANSETHWNQQTGAASLLPKGPAPVFGRHEARWFPQPRRPERRSNYVPRERVNKPICHAESRRCGLEGAPGRVSRDSERSVGNEHKDLP